MSLRIGGPKPALCEQIGPKRHRKCPERCRQGDRRGGETVTDAEAIGNQPGVHTCGNGSGEHQCGPPFRAQAKEMTGRQHAGRQQEQLEGGNGACDAEIARKPVLAQRHAERNQRSRSGDIGDAVDDAAERGGDANAGQVDDKATEKADDQRIAHQIPADLPQQFAGGAAGPGIFLAFRLFHQQRAGDHHRRQVHGDQDRHGHDAIRSDRAADKRQADEDRIGKGRGDAGQNADTRIPPKQPCGHDMAGGPGHGDAGKIGDPQSKRRSAAKIRFGDGPEQQERHGDLEDELAHRLADIGLQQAGADDDPADENQQEDRKDIGESFGHAGRGPWKSWLEKGDRGVVAACLKHVAQKRAVILRGRHAQNQELKALGANLEDRDAQWVSGPQKQKSGLGPLILVRSRRRVPPVHMPPVHPWSARVPVRRKASFLPRLARKSFELPIPAA
ncbi:hypothetical protein RHSP_22331 [Rhizobium freirei PRF 81]|uniref:Uncharacterized protein n=1 Tax=Rhizobium freirei PRF 81 TaxID=363754 RepID=N6UUJ2_9HYPH|nr:hypothetical protein RHSP_22331 [Rhizobium freirei PRF 81]